MLACPLPAWPAHLQFAGKWGGKGTGDGLFKSILGITATRGGDILVCGEARPACCAASSRAALPPHHVPVQQFSDWGNACPLALLQSLPADEGGDRIQRFTSTGTFVSAFGEGRMLEHVAMAAKPARQPWQQRKSAMPILRHGLASLPSPGQRMKRVPLWCAPFAGRLSGPVAIAQMDTSTDVLVANELTQRIERYASAKAALATPAGGGHSWHALSLVMPDQHLKEALYSGGRLHGPLRPAHDGRRSPCCHALPAHTLSVSQVPLRLDTL